MAGMDKHQQIRGFVEGYYSALKTTFERLEFRPGFDRDAELKHYSEMVLKKEEGLSTQSEKAQLMHRIQEACTSNINDIMNIFESYYDDLTELWAFEKKYQDKYGPLRDQFMKDTGLDKADTYVRAPVEFRHLVLATSMETAVDNIGQVLEQTYEQRMRDGIGGATPMLEELEHCRDRLKSAETSIVDALKTQGMDTLEALSKVHAYLNAVVARNHSKE